MKNEKTLWEGTRLAKAVLLTLGIIALAIAIAPKHAFADSPYVDDSGNKFNYYSQWGTTIISSFETVTEDVTIPDSIDGNTAITLGNQAIKYCTFGVPIKSLNLGSSMNTNGWSKQFKSSDSLEKLTLGNGFKLTKQEFGNCPNLHDVYLLGDQTSLDFNSYTPSNSPFEATYQITFHTLTDNANLDKFVEGNNADGNYTYTIVQTVDVNAEGNAFKIADIPAQNYTGEAVMPEPVVTDAQGNTLVKDVDYTLSYSENTEAGTATVTVTGTDVEPTSMTKESPKGYRYVGATAANFEIVDRDISNATVSDIADQTYTGSALTPEVTASMHGNSLTQGTDYTVEYSDNTKVGTAKASITGIGDYAGTIEKEFKIVEAQKKDEPKSEAKGGATTTSDKQDAKTAADNKLPQTGDSADGAAGALIAVAFVAAGAVCFARRKVA